MLLYVAMGNSILEKSSMRKTFSLLTVQKNLHNCLSTSLLHYALGYSYALCKRIERVIEMKLAVECLSLFSDQDRIDLAKIWPHQNLDLLEQSLDQHERLFVSRFNGRLLAAVMVEIDGEYATRHTYRLCK